MREMKDSGIAWIGKIPRKWKIKKIKNIICNDKEGIKIGPFGSALANKTMTDGPYNIYGQANLVNDDFSYTKNTINKSTFHTLKSYQVLPNDICLSMMGTIGKCKTVPIGIKAGIMDSHLIKIRLDKTQILNKFFEYVYDKDLSDICITEMQYVKKGSIMDGLNTSIVKNLRIIIPSVLEQQAIADFLDAKCEDINSLTADIQKQINLLKEYKKSVITQAVTKGLDPNVEMKDSGIEWIGKLPKSWRIFRLKYLLAKPLQYGASEIGIEFTKDLPRYIRITDVDENNHLKEKGKLSLSFEKAKPYILKDNCVLFARSGATVGKTFFYKRSYGLAAFAGYLIAAVTKPSLLCVNWLYYYTQSNTYWNWVKQIFNQSTIQNIGADKYNNLPITVPTLKEQQAIADFLDAKCADIDAAIAGKQKQLDVLKEYKKSLIYEYVTGKKEVPCREYDPS